MSFIVWASCSEVCEKCVATNAGTQIQLSQRLDRPTRDLLDNMSYFPKYICDTFEKLVFLLKMIRNDSTKSKAL